MMSEYKIVSILWRDHTFYEREPLNDKKAIKNILPTLSIGLIWKETEEVVIIVSDIERFTRHGDIGNFTVIFKGSIVAIKEYGIIKLRKIRGG